MDVNKMLKIGKVVVTVASVGVTFAQTYFNKKDLDETVAKKVEEALKNQAKEARRRLQLTATFTAWHCPCCSFRVPFYHRLLHF